MIRIMILFLVLSFAQVATAQTWIEERTDTTTESSIPRLDGWVASSITPKFGSFGWFQVDKNYAEAYLGPAFTFKKSFQFGVGAGVEQTKKPMRLGSFFWAGNKNSQVLFIAEGLGSGWWYKTEFNWNAAGNLGLGVMTERFKGSGPRIQYTIKQTPVTLWTAYLVHPAQNRLLVGLRTRF